MPFDIGEEDPGQVDQDHVRIGIIFLRLIVHFQHTVPDILILPGMIDHVPDLPGSADVVKKERGNRCPFPEHIHENIDESSFFKQNVECQRIIGEDLDRMLRMRGDEAEIPLRERDPLIAGIETMDYTRLANAVKQSFEDFGLSGGMLPWGP